MLEEVQKTFLKYVLTSSILISILEKSEAKKKEIEKMTIQAKTPTSFQILSRNNDVNGIPYRLMLVYSQNGEVLEAYEERSSMPDQRRILEDRNLAQLISFHLSPSEYNETKKAYKEILQHVH